MAFHSILLTVDTADDCYQLPLPRPNGNFHFQNRIERNLPQALFFQILSCDEITLNISLEPR